ncbi:uncharacterized protein ARMOST_12164 [Armillaria ostoyae]|uniref:Uncharacterized protein n=1 Tax=Armillaria ostoyae TaxID=47428 RepID=A0A284RJ54_ARMOS|nr:uncharacterized protein ARMOST_12164 [Armillaria ostoyae]
MLVRRISRSILSRVNLLHPPIATITSRNTLGQLQPHLNYTHVLPHATMDNGQMMRGDEMISEHVAAQSLPLVCRACLIYYSQRYIYSIALMLLRITA